MFPGLNACEKKSYIFLRKELPVRLANIMKEIALLPDNLSRTPSVRLVSAWYARSFEEVLQYEKLEPSPATIEKYVIRIIECITKRFTTYECYFYRFCADLIKIRDRHSDVVQTMAQGVIELKASKGDVVEPSMELSIQYFLDRFYMSRISIRMLINQHSKFIVCLTQRF